MRQNDHAGSASPGSQNCFVFVIIKVSRLISGIFKQSTYLVGPLWLVEGRKVVWRCGCHLRLVYTQVGWISLRSHHRLAPNCTISTQQSKTQCQICDFIPGQKKGDFTDCTGWGFTYKERLPYARCATRRAGRLGDHALGLVSHLWRRLSVTLQTLCRVFNSCSLLTIPVASAENICV